jgi:hypothetical protein
MNADHQVGGGGDWNGANIWSRLREVGRRIPVHKHSNYPVPVLITVLMISMTSSTDSIGN